MSDLAVATTLLLNMELDQVLPSLWQRRDNWYLHNRWSHEKYKLKPWGIRAAKFYGYYIKMQLVLKTLYFVQNYTYSVINCLNITNGQSWIRLICLIQLTLNCWICKCLVLITWRGLSFSDYLSLCSRGNFQMIHTFESRPKEENQTIIFTDVLEKTDFFLAFLVSFEKNKSLLFLLF